MAGEVLDHPAGLRSPQGERLFRLWRFEIAARIANLTTEKSSRQLRCHVLPFADMEAASHIRRLLALGAVWNIHLHDYPGANALLSNGDVPR